MPFYRSRTCTLVVCRCCSSTFVLLSPMSISSWPTLFYPQRVTIRSIRFISLQGRAATATIETSSQLVPRELGGYPFTECSRDQHGCRPGFVCEAACAHRSVLGLFRTAAAAGAGDAGR